MIKDQPFLNNSYSVGQILSILDNNSALIICAWLCVFLYKMTRTALGLHYIYTIQHRQVSPVNAQWANWLECKRKELGIKKAVVFLQSGLVKMPLTVGHLKNVVLIPIGLLANLPTRQVESILLHELAHIRRKDYLVNIIQGFIDIFFFFNPAFIWISSLIRQEREKCCDDIAIEHCNATDFLQALLSFENIRHESHYAMALTMKNNLLYERVKRIVSNTNSRVGKAEAFILLLTVIMMGFCFLAFRSKDDNPPKVTVENISENNKPAPVNTITSQVENKGNVVRKKNNTSVHKDTVPTAPSRNFTFEKNGSISYNEADSISNSASTINYGFVKNGKQYIVRKKQNEIISLIIDGKDIPKKDYPKYSLEITEMEKKQQELDSIRNILNQKDQKIDSLKNSLEKKKTVLVEQQEKLTATLAILK